MKLFLLCFAITFYAQTIHEYPVLSKGMFKNDRYPIFIQNVTNKHLLENNIKDIKLTIKKNDVGFRKAFKDGKYKIIFLSPMEYFEYESFYKKNSKEKFIPKLNNKYFMKFYLLGDIKNFNILDKMKNYTVSIMDGNLVSEIWLKSVLLQKGKQFPKKIEYSTKVNTMVNNVFFKKNRLTVVSENSYKILLEINPQIKQYTKILLSSKEIYFSLILLMHKDISKQEREKFYQFEQALDIFLENTGLTFGGTLKGGKILKESEIKKLRSIITKYQKLNL